MTSHRVSNILAILATGFFAATVIGDLSCTNEIYCRGPLLHTVQMAVLHADSKTFVDMKLRASPNDTLYHFGKFMERTFGHPNKCETQQFVKENFEPVGSEFRKWIPSDWKKNPAIISRIKDPSYRQWAVELNAIWLNLGRMMKKDVNDNPDLYSIIPVPNPVIVPGGRFREFYYWDSYWIIKGLLQSEMINTVKGMIDNFLSIIVRYGHVPNGGRVYYLGRSQPPLLLAMMKEYIDVTSDVGFLRKALPVLEREYDYWVSNHSFSVIKNGGNYTVFRYIDRSPGPRPESYWEDVELFRKSGKSGLFSEIRATAESGWDFSSRWVIKNGSNDGKLSDLKTKYIIPVDLNAIMCWNADLMSKFYKRVGNTAKATEYAEKKARIVEAINQVLWSNVSGIWLDYDTINKKNRNYFYPSNLTPLWTGCYNPPHKEYLIRNVIRYINSTKIMRYLGGIPTSQVHTGEQWDFPNAWPPLQHIIVTLLAESKNTAAQKLGFELASRWVLSNYAAYKKTGNMFEKYDATAIGRNGTGGEYRVQVGFGWTNGVILDFLDRYSVSLKPEPGSFDTDEESWDDTENYDFLPCET